MVECFNQSLLQLLRAYVDAQSDWERYLPLVLYGYRTSVHASTGISPFVLMFGHHLWSMPFAKRRCLFHGTERYGTERNGTERNGTQGYFTERTSVIAERLF